MSVLEGLSKSPRRFVVVDFNHLAYKYVHGMQTVLTTNWTFPNGQVRKITTNVQNGTAKALFRWTRSGYDIPAVCFDRVATPRKDYFNYVYPGVNKANGYKGGRAGGSSDLIEAMNMTFHLFIESGISCYAGAGYEADDLIKAVIDRCKEAHPDMPIDVVTGDSDMLPLVDDQVSVFLSSRITTFAEAKDIEKTKYVQVTPRNYAEIAEGLSVNKTSNLSVPYNTQLLIKMIRGDKSDNIPPLTSRSFPPKKINSMIATLQEQDVDLSDIFRYGGDVRQMANILFSFMANGDVQKIMLEDMAEDGLFWPYDEWYNITPEAEEHYSPAKGTGKDGFGGLIDVSQAFKNYTIMNLNHPYAILNPNGERVELRKAATLKDVPQRYSGLKMAEVFRTLGINIPVTAKDPE